MKLSKVCPVYPTENRESKSGLGRQDDLEAGDSANADDELENHAKNSEEKRAAATESANADEENGLSGLDLEELLGELPRPHRRHTAACAPRCRLHWPGRTVPRRGRRRQFFCDRSKRLLRRPLFSARSTP